MKYFVLGFLAFVVLGIVSSVLRRRRNPFLTVSLVELPDALRGDIERLVPEFQPSTVRLTKNRDEAHVRGEYLGVPASIEAEFNPRAELVEFEFEAVSGSRMRAGISPEALPQAARATVDRVLGPERGAFVETSLTGGTLAGEGNFKIEGDVGDWHWEIEVSESGRLLEIERERRRR